MNELHRNVYKMLYRRCKLIDSHSALKNMFMSEPSHLFSLKDRNIERISGQTDVVSNLVSNLNHNAEYFSPSSQISLTSLLYDTFKDYNYTQIQTLK